MSLDPRFFDAEGFGKWDAITEHTGKVLEGNQELTSKFYDAIMQQAKEHAQSVYSDTESQIGYMSKFIHHHFTWLKQGTDKWRYATDWLNKHDWEDGLPVPYTVTVDKEQNVYFMDRRGEEASETELNFIFPDDKTDEQIFDQLRLWQSMDLLPSVLHVTIGKRFKVIRKAPNYKGI